MQVTFEEIMAAVMRYGTMVANRYAGGNMQSRTEALEAESGAYTKVFDLVSAALCRKQSDGAQTLELAFTTDEARSMAANVLAADTGGSIEQEDVAAMLHLMADKLDELQRAKQALRPTLTYDNAVELFCNDDTDIQRFIERLAAVGIDVDMSTR